LTFEDLKVPENECVYNEIKSDFMSTRLSAFQELCYNFKF